VGIEAQERGVRKGGMGLGELLLRNRFTPLLHALSDYEYYYTTHVQSTTSCPEGKQRGGSWIRREISDEQCITLKLHDNSTEKSPLSIPMLLT
jgi:hypothetical protein